MKLPKISEMVKALQTILDKVVLRKTTPEEERKAIDRVSAAQIELMTGSPFWATLAQKLKPIVRHNVGTMRIGKDGTLFIDPAFLAKLTDTQLVFVLAHEAGHCAFLHFDRQGARDQNRFNISGDQEINAALIHGGVGEPPFAIVGGIYQKEWDGMAAEEVYELLPVPPQPPTDGEGDPGDCESDSPDEEGDESESGGDDGEEAGDEERDGDGDGEDDQDQEGPRGTPGRPRPDQKQGSKEQGKGKGRQPQDGKGKGDQKQDGKGQGQQPQGDDRNGNEDPQGGGEVITPAPQWGGGDLDQDIGSEKDRAEQEKDAGEWKDALAEAVQAARESNTMGTLPGSLQAEIEAILNPKVDWREKLRRFLGSNGPRNDVWFGRPSRRDDDMPGRVSSAPRVAVLIDTSGSISDENLRDFIDEVYQIAQDLSFTPWAIVCDAQVHGVYKEDATVDDIKAGLVGRGGSDFNPAFNVLEQEEFDGVVIAFTDGYIAVPDSPPPFVQATMWCLRSENGAGSERPAPWGEAFTLDGQIK